MIIVVVDAGHGGKDSGAIGHGLMEKNVNLNIARKIHAKMRSYKGVQVKLTRSTDKTLTLKERVDFANKLDADLFLSIHINAGGGQGFESFIHSGLSNTSSTRKTQETIHKEVQRAIDMNERGLKKANFYVLRHTKMSAILTENGFIDNKHDATMLGKEGYLSTIADGHVNGIVRAFGLEEVDNTKYPKKKTYRVIAGSFKNKNNAIQLMNELTKKELDSFLMVSIGYHRVVSGSFQNKENAKDRVQFLKEHGYDSFIDSVNL